MRPTLLAAGIVAAVTLGGSAYGQGQQPAPAVPQAPPIQPVQPLQIPSTPPPIQQQADQAFGQQAQWLYDVYLNDTDEIAGWVTEACGTRDSSGVRAFIVQQGDGMDYAAHVWCRVDRADVAWVREEEDWDGGTPQDVSDGLATGRVGVIGFIRDPAGDTLIMLRQAK